MESATKGTGRNFSLRTVLLIMLIVGFGVLLAVYTIGGVFSTVASLARGTTLQSTSTSTNSGTARNCTRTSG